MMNDSTSAGGDLPLLLDYIFFSFPLYDLWLTGMCYGDYTSLQEAAKKGVVAREDMVSKYSVEAMGEVLVGELSRVYQVLESQGKIDKLKEDLLEIDL